jgi:hypothetical protein
VGVGVEHQCGLRCWCTTSESARPRKVSEGR